MEKGKSNYRNYPVNLSLMNYIEFPPSTQGYQTLLVNINELIHLINCIYMSTSAVMLMTESSTLVLLDETTMVIVYKISPH